MDPSPLALGDIFPRQRIRFNVASTDKESLFEEMIDLLASTASSPFPRQEAMASLMERESMMTTGIGKGIAIPHGKVDGIDRIYGGIGISGTGIDYDAIDGVPVRVAFMILHRAIIQKNTSGSSNALLRYLIYLGLRTRSWLHRI